MDALPQPAFHKPEPAEIRAALQRHASFLADEPIEFLAEGWDVWAFTAGDHVLRFPKSEEVIAALAKEQRLLPVLGPMLSLPVPAIDIYGESGPNDAPFIGHRLLPGVRVMEARRPLAESVGRDFGRFLRELHSFPVERALALGVPLDEGPTLRADRARQYEDVIRRVFPLVSCEARVRIEAAYEENLNNAANFDYEARLVHRDLDSNTLIDETTGELSAVIDFGDAIVGNSAFDLWLPVFGFARLGITAQTRECLTIAGVTDEALARMMPELEFINFRWPLLDILHGLDIGNEDFVLEGIRELNASLPRDIVC